MPRLYAVQAVYELEDGVSAPDDSADIGPLLAYGRLNFVSVVPYDGQFRDLGASPEDW